MVSDIQCDEIKVLSGRISKRRPDAFRLAEDIVRLEERISRLEKSLVDGGIGAAPADLQPSAEAKVSKSLQHAVPDITHPSADHQRSDVSATPPAAVRRIVLMPDFFRLHAVKSDDPAAADFFQRFNLTWLTRVLGPVLRTVSTVPIESYLPDRTGTAWRAMLDWAQAEGLDAQSFWPRMYDGILPPAADTVLEEATAGACVIGFELSPAQRQWLVSRAVPTIQLFVHPVRFYDDLLWGATSPHRQTRETLRAWSIPDHLCRIVAGLIAGSALTMRERPEKSPDGGIQLPPNSALLVGQTSKDQVVLRNGRFVTLEDYQERLSELLTEHPRALFSPHPLAEDWRKDWDILKRLGRVEFIRTNTYQLLAQPNISRIISLSSSVGIEAEYFGKSSAFLLHSPLEALTSGLSPADEAPAALDAVILDPRFWFEALSGLAPTQLPPPGALAYKPSRIRLALGQAWGYGPFEFGRASALAVPRQDVTPWRVIDLSPFRDLPPQLLAEALYREVLQRPATPREIAFWTEIATRRGTQGCFEEFKEAMKIHGGWIEVE